MDYAAINIHYVLRIFIHIMNMFNRFTKAERELKAARPFGYGPRKFYQSTALVKGIVIEDKKDKNEKTEASPSVTPTSDKPEDLEAEKTAKRMYIAITSDRGYININLLVFITVFHQAYNR